MGRRHKLPGISKENTTRRNVLVGTGYTFGGVFLLGSISGEEDDPDDTAEASPEDEDSDDSTTEEQDDGAGEDETDSDASDTEDADSEPQWSTLESVRADEDLWDLGHDSFSGSSNAVEDTSIAGAFTVFSYSHDGTENFIIEILNDGGELERVAVNEIGEVDAVRGFGMGTGEYTLDITADGSWNIDVAEPLPPDEEIHQVPADASGDTHDVVGPIELNGGETVYASHDGDENFIVQAWDEDATSSFDQEIWVNEIGEYEGENVNQFSAIAWIAVQADGNWELEIT